MIESQRVFDVLKIGKMEVQKKNFVSLCIYLGLHYLCTTYAQRYI